MTQKQKLYYNIHYTSFNDEPESISDIYDSLSYALRVPRKTAKDVFQKMQYGASAQEIGLTLLDGPREPHDVFNYFESYGVRSIYANAVSALGEAAIKIVQDHIIAAQNLALTKAGISKDFSDE